MNTPDPRSEGAEDGDIGGIERFERHDAVDATHSAPALDEAGSIDSRGGEDSVRPEPPSKSTPLTIFAFQDLEPSVAEERAVKQISEMMRSLIRALKAKKMYPSNNPVLSRIVGELKEVMMGILEDVEELTLTIEIEQILYRGTPVYKNPSRRDSLAYRFHRDGITQISFLKGLTPPELNAFLDVLAQATEPQGAEEDLVTILWEQEFTNVRYSYIAFEDLQEGLLDNIEPGEGGDSDELSDVPWPHGDSEETSYSVMMDPDEPFGEGSGERSDDWAQLVPTVEITERCPAHLLEISSQELQELAEEVHLEHSRPLAGVVLEILTEVAEDERHPERFADLARAFSELVIIAVAHADFGHAAQVLATLRTMSAERGVDATSFLPDASDLVAQALASLQQMPEADTVSLPEFFAHLGDQAINPICDLLQDQDLEGLQPVLASGLSLLASQNLSQVQRRLEKASGSAARHILAAVAESTLPEANRVIAAAVSHFEPRVRKEALRALVARRAAGQPEARECIISALQDDDPQVRSAALAAVRVNPSETIASHLLQILESTRFKEMKHSERQTYFDVLVRMQAAPPRETLREWASRPIWWPDAVQAERRTLAAWALARGGDPGDRALLESRCRSPFPGVRKACKRALAEVPSGGSRRAPVPDPRSNSR